MYKMTWLSIIKVYDEIKQMHQSYRKTNHIKILKNIMKHHLEFFKLCEIVHNENIALFRICLFYNILLIKLINDTIRIAKQNLEQLRICKFAHEKLQIILEHPLPSVRESLLFAPLHSQILNT